MGSKTGKNPLVGSQLPAGLPLHPRRDKTEQEKGGEIKRSGNGIQGTEQTPPLIEVYVRFMYMRLIEVPQPLSPKPSP